MGLQIVLCSYATIENNTFLMKPTASYHLCGLLIYQSDETKITNNLINQANFGIWIVNSSSCLIILNLIQHSS